MRFQDAHAPDANGLVRPRRRGRAATRGGMAMILSLTVLFLCSMLTVHVLDTTTFELSALRNTIDYERALYLANAGVHAAASELEADATWRSVTSDGPFPADGSYQATATNGLLAGQVTVTSQGVSGSVLRTVVATLEL